MKKTFKTLEANGVRLNSGRTYKTQEAKRVRLNGVRTFKELENRRVTLNGVRTYRSADILGVKLIELLAPDVILVVELDLERGTQTFCKKIVSLSIIF